MNKVLQSIYSLLARRSLGALLAVAVASVALSLWGATPVQAQQPGITSPAPGSNITDDLVPVFGTAVSSPFDKYELHYKPASSGDDAYSYFDGASNQVTNGQLGTWNTGALAPGTYTLRLRVVFPDGNYSEHLSPNINVGLAAPEPTETPTPTPTADEFGNDDDGDDGNNQNDGPLGPQTGSGPTETPIPTLTPTFGPSPTTSVGQVAQSVSDAEATEAATPTVEAIALVDTDLTNNQSTSDVPLTAENAAASSAAGAETGAEVAAAAGSQSASRELGESLSINRLRSYFFNGIRYSAAFFIGVIALFGGKRLFDWAWMNYT